MLRLPAGRLSSDIFGSSKIILDSEAKIEVYNEENAFFDSLYIMTSVKNDADRNFSNDIKNWFDNEELYEDADDG